jgi:FkbM family methyltransferase
MMETETVFDVGLHNGADTDYYLKKGFAVVAFEADADHVARCGARFAEEIACERLRIVEGAIASAGAGQHVTFYKNLTKTDWGTIEKKWADRNSKLDTEIVTVKVPRVDMDEAFNTFGVPHYLKIDIEGADRLILRSLEGQRKRPLFISIESEKSDWGRLVEEMEILRALGYRKFRPVQQSTIPGARITARTLSGQEFTYKFSRHSSGPFGDDVCLPWLSFDDCLDEYERIFRWYRAVGDAAFFRRLSGVGKLVNGIGHIVGIPLPGWYDTHATL